MFESGIGDDRAIVPIISVVLLLGLTLLVATGVGAIALSMLTSTTPPPAIDWTISTADDELLVRHEGGPMTDGTRLFVSVDGWDQPLSLAAVGPQRWSVGTEATIPLQPRTEPVTVGIWWEVAGNYHILLAERTLDGAGR